MSQSVHIATRGLAILLASCLVLCSACQDETAPVLAERTVPALVGLAQSYHSQADLALEAGDDAEAERALRNLIHDLEDSRQSGLTVAELQMDAHARLARLMLERGKHDDALRIVDAGLAMGEPWTRRSIFGGYLLQLKGDVLRAQNKPREAVAAHKDAILVFKGLLEQP